MGKRKIICLLTAYPEVTHQSRVIRGLIRQCKEYGYHLMILSTTIHMDSPRPKYVQGEINIYRLLNTEYVDGIILDTAPLTEDKGHGTFRAIADRILKGCKKPVVCIEIPWDSYPLIENENEEILRETVRHAIQFHGKRKLCILTGHRETEVSHSRLRVYLDEAAKYGVTVPEESIIFGDFWYSGGEQLADRFLSGELELPEAVICANDPMALGLLIRLNKHGIRVPEDLIILGFEAFPEALCNDIPLSTYEANDMQTAANAVNYLRSVIEPDQPLKPVSFAVSSLFHPGKTCGCNADYLASAHAFKDALYLAQYYSEDCYDSINIGLLMESYIFEDLTSAETPDECLNTILENSYLIRPMNDLYICVAPDWMEMHSNTETGYPEQMKMIMRCSSSHDISFISEDGVFFETKEMLPQLFDESKEPAVFYFSPMHFNEHAIGYAVLERSLNETVTLNLVYKNWLRFVNNAMEMVRAKHKLMHMSVRDEMTGTYNRRGLYLKLDEMLRSRRPEDLFFAAVIDMDGLKTINDTFGHSEGDFGIRLVASAAASITYRHEICVRAGGDEFYIVGVGQYTENTVQERTEQFLQRMRDITQNYDKPYSITASIGCAVCEITEHFNADEAIRSADEIMYAYKVRHKLQRLL